MGGCQLGGQDKTRRLFLTDIFRVLAPEGLQLGIFQGQATAQRAGEAGGESIRKWPLLLHVYKIPSDGIFYPRKRG